MKSMFVGFLTLVLAFSAWTSAHAAVIGSIADSRFNTGWTLDGDEQANARAKLLNNANFSPAATVTEAISIVDTAAPITSGLLSGFDVFYIGYLDDGNANAFTSAELTAMTSYVTGGGVMVVTCDDAGHDAVCSNFGFPATTSASNPMTPTAAGAAHPMFDGPFGVVPSFNMSGTQGYFTSSAGATILAQDAAGPNPVVLEYSLGAGTVILMADVDIIANAATAGDTITSNNDILLGNLFAYAAGASGGPTNSSPRQIPTLSTWALTLMSLLLAGVGIVAVGRKKVQI